MSGTSIFVRQIRYYYILILIVNNTFLHQIFLSLLCRINFFAIISVRISIFIFFHLLISTKISFPTKINHRGVGGLVTNELLLRKENLVDAPCFVRRQCRLTKKAKESRLSQAGCCLIRSADTEFLSTPSRSKTLKNPAGAGDLYVFLWPRSSLGIFNASFDQPAK